jgi:hypothetical protein
VSLFMTEGWLALATPRSICVPGPMRCVLQGVIGASLRANAVGNRGDTTSNALARCD